MNRLSSILVGIVRSKIEQAVVGGGPEVRLIFNGPPLEILSLVFDALVAELSAAGIAVPVVLRVFKLEDGQANPAVGSSGRCDDNHLLNMRNSSATSTYVALVPPGQHSNMSVSTTTDEFGMSAANKAGNVPFEAWWSDEFLQELVDTALADARVPESGRDAAKVLVERAASAADAVDLERTQRTEAWRVLSRVCAAALPGARLGSLERLSLACGVPRTRDGGIAEREQSATLDKIADALSDGFGTGIDRAREGATAEDTSRLGEFLDHLRQACDRPTAFERAAAAYYSPSKGLELPDPPAWWEVLTVEKWSELLVEEAVATGDIRMVCKNGIMPFARGMPFLVKDRVELEFETVGPEAGDALSPSSGHQRTRLER